MVRSEEKVVAFVLALCEGKEYGSPNYRWFSEHYSQFLYIDRIVVSKDNKGQGIGCMLYEALLEHSTTMGLDLVAEINLLPENVPSLQFHSRFGFREIGQFASKGGAKVVSLQARKV